MQSSIRFVLHNCLSQTVPVQKVAAEEETADSLNTLFSSSSKDKFQNPPEMETRYLV